MHDATHARVQTYLPRWVRAAHVPGIELRHTATTLDGVLMMADISGFTKLGEDFAQQGAKGTEDFWRLVDSVFQVVDEAVQRWGGDTLRYVGDAPVVLWPGGAGLELTAARAVACAIDLQDHLRGFVARDGREISLKVGIAVGSVILTVVGGNTGRWEALAAGTGFEGLAVALADGSGGEVVVTPQIATLVRSRFVLETTGHWHARVVSARADPEVPTQAPDPAVDDLAPLVPLLPRGLMARIAAGHDAWLGEHRTVTTLFCRVEGLEWVTRRAAERLNAVTAAIQGVVYGLDGEIPSFAVDDKGTVYVATWGLPTTTHEDDPARAVEAAWRIRRVLDPFYVGTSIGITTGKVYCGERGGAWRREYGVIGAKVNLAARLMSHAGDGILCDAETRERASRRYAFTRLDAIQVKGRPEPVDVYRPDPEPRTASPSAQQLVGRRHERELLQRVVERRKTEGARVVIEGEAGIGKSRLLQALHDVEGAPLLVASADAIECHTPYFGLRKVFDRIVGLEGIADSRQRREAALAWIDAREELRALAPLLNAPLQIDLPETDTTRAIEGTARAEAAQKLALRIVNDVDELVLVVDDARWLDSASWGVLWSLVRDRPDAVFVLATRPRADDVPDEVDRIVALPGTVVLRPQPFAGADVGLLIAQTLGVAEVPPALVAVIAARSEGNPFYAEELALTLRDRGLLRLDGGALEFGGPDAVAAASALPDTVEGIVTSRLDHLTPIEQLTLKTASAVGRLFEARIIEDVYPVSTERDHVPRALEVAVERDLTRLATLRPNPAYLFKHVITREVVYGMLLFAQRRALHRAIATWYEEHAGGDLGPHLALLAHHWRHSDAPDRAVAALEAAGEQAIRNYANEEAVGFLSQAIQLLDDGTARPVEPARRARWERVLGEARSRLGQYAQAPGHLARAAALLGGGMPEGRLGLAFALMIEGFRQLWRRWVRAPALAEDPARYTLLANIYEELGLASYFAGDLPKMLYAYIRSVNLAERGGPTPDFARTQAGMAVVFASIPMATTADTYNDRALALAESTGDLYSISVANHYKAGTLLGRGEWNAADGFIRRALDGYTRTGNARRMEEIDNCMLHTRINQGRYGEYRHFLEHLRESGKAREDEQTPLWVEVAELEVAWRRRRVDEGLALLGRVDVRVYKDALFVRRWNGLAVHVRLQAGDLDGAREADAALGKLGRAASFLEVWAYTAKVELALANKEVAAARRALKGLVAFNATFPLARALAPGYAARVELACGRPDDARRLATEALRLATEQQAPWDQWFALEILAECNGGGDQHRELARRLDEAMEASWGVV